MNKQMTLFRLTTLALVFFSLASCSDSDDPAPNDTPAAKKYDIKSGTIHFESDLAGFKGTKIVYFDDFGAKERVEEYEDGVLESCVFSDGKTRYNLDIPAKIAYLVDQHGDRGWEMEFHTWDEIKQFPGYEKDYTKVDNITVVGKNCEAYRYKDIAVFAGWKGLTLYHQQNPNILIKAVKLEEDVKQDPALFAVPNGFTVKELP